MNRELFLAILSMDSYNRGYEPGIDLGLNSDAIGTGVGNATISASNGNTEAQAAGFYAIAYDVAGLGGASGTTRVLMYRGSDTFAALPWDPTGGDINGGYGIALGSPYGPQALLAAEF
jgi:hypothetical protein